MNDATRPDSLEDVQAHERTLVLDEFTEQTAYEIGQIGWKLAAERGLCVVIDIRTFDRQILFLSRPGATAHNAEWVRRKSNTVRRFLKSTYRLVLERGGEEIFPLQAGVDPADFAIAGGGFPLSVAGAGIIGSLTISGLSGREDHMLAVEILAAHLGVSLEMSASPSKVKACRQRAGIAG